MKNIIKLLLLLLLSAINFNLIIKELNITIGGTVGVSLILYKQFSWSYYKVILIINTIMFLASLLLLPKKTTKSIIITTFIYPFLVKLLNSIPSLRLNKVLMLIIGGIISGITTGGILRLGYSTGGLNVFVLILKKHLNIPEYLTNFVISLLILVSGSIVFGKSSLINSIVILTISTIFIKLLNNNVNHCQTKQGFDG